MVKRAASLLMALLIFIGTCACSCNEENAEFSMKNVATYEEKEIGTAIGFTYPGMNLGIDSNNDIILNDSRKKESFCIISDNNGRKLEEYKNDTATGAVSLFTVDEKDNRYVLYEKYADKKENSTDIDITYTLNIYNSTGVKQKSIDIGKKTFTKKQSGITDIAVDSKGNVYLLLRRDVIRVIGSGGKEIKEIPAKEIDYIEIDEADRLITGYFNESAGHSYIEMQNIGTDKSEWKKNLAAGHNIQGMKYDVKSKKLYLLTDKGIFICSNDGKFEGYVFDIKKSSLIDSSIFITDFAVDSNKSIYILAYKNNLSSITEKSSPLLYSYTQVKTNQISKNQKILTVTLKYSEKFIEAAISEFEKENPDIKVELKDYSAATMGTGEDEQNRAQKAEEYYQKAIATGLMAGNCSDIIDVSGLPYKKYADKNVLLNLSETISKDKSFNLNNYRQELFNACKYNNNLYIIPVNFAFNTFCANKDILKKEGLSIENSKWTWEEFLKIAQKITKDTNGDGVPDQYALPKMDAKILFGYILSSEYENFINSDKKTAKFASQEFIRLLKFTKEFSEKHVCSPTLNTSELYQMKDSGTIGFMQGALTNYQMTVLMQQVFNGDVEYLSMPTYSGKASPKNFIPIRSFAINKNSKLTAEAWKFIKTLLSDELQSSPEMYYFPVSNKALKEKADEEIAQNYIYNANKKQNNSRKIKPLTQQDVDFVNKMISELKEIPYSDPQVDKIVADIAEEYFSGKMTAEEVANIIQSKVNIYLGE